MCNSCFCDQNSQICRHPHIVSILGFVEESHMLIMEFVENGNLNEYLTKHTDLDWKTKREITKQIVQGQN